MCPRRHYAGDVAYSIIGFLDKNKDSLFQDFKRLLFNSKDKILSSMWPEGAMDITKVLHLSFAPFCVVEKGRLLTCLSPMDADDEEAADGRDSVQELHDRTGEDPGIEGASLHPLHQAERPEVPSHLRPRPDRAPGSDRTPVVSGPDKL